MENLNLVDGLSLDGIRPAGVGVGVYAITHHDFDPTTHEFKLHSSGLHPTDLRKFEETIAGLEVEGWTLYQLKLVVTEGIGGLRCWPYWPSRALGELTSRESPALQRTGECYSLVRLHF